MDTTSPTGLELDLGGTCDDVAPSPVISETLSVVVNGGVEGRVVGNQSSSTSDIIHTAVSTSVKNNSHTNGGHGPISTTMFGVASVTEFLNSVSKAESTFNSGQGIVSTGMTANHQQANAGLNFCRMGRRIGDVHRHFSYCIRDGKEYGMCVYCGHTLQRNTTRQKHHLSTHCPHAPMDVKARYDQERNSIHTRPAIEFQRKRSIDLPPGAITTSIYSGDIESSNPMTTMDIPVKVERLEERLEVASMVKPDKSVLRMSELDDEDDTPLPSVSLSSNHMTNTSICNLQTRRDIEVSSNSETRFRKPLKLWDHSRRVKKGIVVSSLRELIVRGCTKLNISINEPVRAVLEEDGTEVDDEEYLEYLPDNATILLLRPGEEWKPPGPYDDGLVRSRHIRHRDMFRGDRRDL